MDSGFNYIDSFSLHTIRSKLIYIGIEQRKSVIKLVELECFDRKISKGKTPADMFRYFPINFEFQFKNQFIQAKIYAASNEK